MYPETWEAQLLQPAGGERGKREGRTGVDATGQLPGARLRSVPRPGFKRSETHNIGVSKRSSTQEREVTGTEEDQTELLVLKEVSVKMTFRYPSRGSFCRVWYTGQIAAENGTGLVIGAIWTLAMPGHKGQVLENTT